MSGFLASKSLGWLRCITLSDNVDVALELFENLGCYGYWGRQVLSSAKLWMLLKIFTALFLNV